MRKLSETVVNTSKNVYRDIIPVALFSLAASAVLGPALFLLPLGFGVLLLPLLGVPVMTGIVYACGRMRTEGRGRLRHVLEGTLRFYLPSVGLGLFLALFAVIIGSSWWYYGHKSGMFYFALAVFQTYFSLMALLSQWYALPLLVQRQDGLLRAMGASCKRFVARPMYTAGAFIQALLAAFLLGMTVIGFLALYPGMLGLFLQHCADEPVRERDEALQRETAASAG